MTLQTTDIQPLISILVQKLSDLPELPKRRKNIFDLAGFPRWENVNSNMLAFYFDKNQEHGFGTLFLESFLKLIDKPTLWAEMDYEVFTELHRIDILIAFKNQEVEETKSIDNECYEWAIIIENKIHHTLENPLELYWKKVSVKDETNKVGIVLSPWGQKDKSLLDVYANEEDRKTKVPPITTFLDRQHNKLIEEVQKNLPKFYLQADDRHLLILKDFITNINSMYVDPKERKIMDDSLHFFQDNIDKINQILSLEKKVTEHVVNESIRVMHEFGFEPSASTTNVKSKFFAKTPEDENRLFKFWFNYPSLVKKRELYIHFELLHKLKNFGSEIHNSNTLKKLAEGFPEGIEKIDHSGSDYYLIAKVNHFKLSDLDTTESFYETLYQFMNTYFFDEKNGIHTVCVKLMEDITKATTL